eukprot:TRINITY_DN831_c0_g1_i1.p1 TRINITY_DN831_c0_g1~~TRINITY_DN831_c0_g1_i1.p1  ORF type:complete len:174 (+),score=26.20 TRINITY_DN831_c0_g1_i1:48-569(+)
MGGGDCVKISNMANYAGQYNAYSKSNGKTSYKNGYYYLYSVDYSGNAYWVISTKHGSSDFGKGYCGANIDILDCDYKWKSGSGSGKFTSCSAFEEDVVPECYAEDQPDALHLYNNGLITVIRRNRVLILQFVAFSKRLDAIMIMQCIHTLLVMLRIIFITRKRMERMVNGAVG